MNQKTRQLLAWAQELQAISTAGRFYTKDRFDKERFDRILELSAELSSEISEEPFEQIKGLFEKEDVYQTPKIDTRAILFNEREEVLLIEELDHTWAPPGGWCDYNCNPAANTAKEAWEEAGVHVEPYRLVAVHDQRTHNLPFQFFTCQRFLFLCRLIDGGFQENIETLQSGWFALNDLPPLHPRKIAADQLQLCLEAHRAEQWETRFDPA